MTDETSRARMWMDRIDKIASIVLVVVGIVAGSHAGVQILFSDVDILVHGILFFFFISAALYGLNDIISSKFMEEPFG